jgi:hypothetical protein
MALAFLAGIGLKASARGRLRGLVAPSRAAAVSEQSRPNLRVSKDWTWPVALLAGLAVALLVAFPVGLVAGLLTTWCGGRWLARLPSRDQAQRAERRSLDLPLAADLLAATLLAGATAEGGLTAVADALGPGVGRDLARAAQALATGASVDEAWAAAPLDLEPIAGVFRRSRATGAPAAPGLIALATDLRGTQRAAWRERAGRVGVRSALPLGACFLPAFVLIGIVPVVVGLLHGVFG